MTQTLQEQALARAITKVLLMGPFERVDALYHCTDEDGRDCGDELADRIVAAVLSPGGEDLEKLRTEAHHLLVDSIARDILAELTPKAPAEAEAFDQGVNLGALLRKKIEEAEAQRQADREEKIRRAPGAYFMLVGGDQ